MNIKHLLPSLLLLLAACTPSSHKTNDMSNISDTCCREALAAVTAACPQAPADLAEKGIRQAAALWRATDGSEAEFVEFVKTWYEGTPEGRQTLFEKLSRTFELFAYHHNQLTIELGRPTVLSGDEPTGIDYLMSAYSPSAHFSDDFFQSKAAFVCVLNFPNYTLAEKDSLGTSWSRLQWAYARMGDRFTDRIPAQVLQADKAANNEAENYISDYNIYMGRLLNEQGRRLFPQDMVLLSHWNLRDELKSNYADVPNANEKQEMIYQVMQRIVCQDIPKEVINSGQYDWAPFSNRLWKASADEQPLDGRPDAVSPTPETDCRYRHILDQFHAYLDVDRYSPAMPTAISRTFDGSLEVSETEIESLFTQLVSSPEVARVAALIRERLGRDLRPYDIWYDGFKPRSTMPEDQLTAQTRRRYPNAEAFQKDMPRQLMNLGFSQADARYLADRIVVEPARGSGHAWECAGRWEPARLRTRIGAEGMDYKGYNIAVHEFGHNVEMVLDLYLIDHYMLYGVPNTAFTEAMAFLFQNRDLQLLGYGPHELDANTTLDIFWGMYEIMGVSLVEMGVWHWLYDHPEATPAQLRDATLAKAREVWNRWYAPVLGEPDSPLLAIYSHMVDVPLYLPAYPFGHLIHYQLEEHLAQCPDAKAFASELKRIYTQGRLTPNAWMQGAVGSRVSVQPILQAVSRLLDSEL